jgi:hypothetical protein
MSASVTDTNRRVRTRTHGGVAGVRGDRGSYADQTRLEEINCDLLEADFWPRIVF